MYILRAVYVDMTLPWLKGTHYLMLLGINCCSSQDTLYKATRVVNSLLRIQDNHNDSTSCINPGFKLHLVPADSVAQIAKNHPSPELAYAFQGYLPPQPNGICIGSENAGSKYDTFSHLSQGTKINCSNIS